MSNSLFTREVRHLLISQPWPKGFKWDCREDDEIGCLNFIIWERNFVELGHDDILQIRGLFNTTFPKVTAMGIPIRLVKQPGYGPLRGE